MRKLMLCIVSIMFCCAAGCTSGSKVSEPEKVGTATVITRVAWDNNPMTQNAKVLQTWVREPDQQVIEYQQVSPQCQTQSQPQCSALGKAEPVTLYQPVVVTREGQTKLVDSNHVGGPGIVNNASSNAIAGGFIGYGISQIKPANVTAKGGGGGAGGAGGSGGSAISNSSSSSASSASAAAASN